VYILVNAPPINNKGGIDEIAYEFLFVLVSEEIRAKRLPKRAKNLVEMNKKTKNLTGSPS
jgi:hypothetical protein